MSQESDRAISELKAALAEHDSTYPDGDWRAANDRIGRARRVANAVIISAGLWPQGRPAIGNDKAIELLSRI